MDDFDPIWQENGVWKVIDKEPVLLKPGYFAYRRGQLVDFNRDYYVPFNNKFAAAMRKIQPRTMIFVEKGFGPGGPAWGADDASDVVYAPHWYDPVVLVMKRFNSWLNYDRGRGKLVLGVIKIKQAFKEQLARPKIHAKKMMGDIPVLIGEVGIAYDLDDKSAYRTGDFSAQIKAFDRTLTALEDNLHHFTLWNYTADNTNARGDKWNDEDLSIFSRDQQLDPNDINSGGRALKAIIRPYPLAISGTPQRIEFNIDNKHFIFVFKHDPKLDEPTLIYIPDYQYKNNVLIEISDGTYEYLPEQQVLRYFHSNMQETHTIILKPDLKKDAL